MSESESDSDPTDSYYQGLPMGTVYYDKSKYLKDDEGFLIRIVPRLFDICLQQCISNATRITDVGDVTYEVVKPVLEKMGPSQLYTVEQNSPHLVPETDELWVELIKKDFSPQEVQEYNISTSDDIRQRYFDLMEAKRVRITHASAMVKAQYDALAKEKAKNRIVTLDIFDDPAERMKRKRRLHNQTSPSALKKMSVVKRARIETMSNPIFSPSNLKIESKSAKTSNIDTGPVTREEADRRRQEKLNERLAEKRVSKPQRSLSSTGSVVTSKNESKQSLITPYTVTQQVRPPPYALAKRDNPSNIQSLSRTQTRQALASPSALAGQAHHSTRVIVPKKSSSVFLKNTPRIVTSSERSDHKETPKR
ncbi:RNA polymerase II transcription factor SIII subunit A-domain-containing protein [Dipodascopsis uninucleata]